jgi:hypothetical protein
MRMVEIITKENWIKEYDFFNKFKESPYFDVLLETYENLNTDILFKSKVHGQAHIERVIFYSLILSWKYNLDKRDTDILRYAASLHDTKRENDGWDVEHGRRAAIDSIDYAKINPDDKNILQAVITAHSANDNDMKDIIEEFEVKNFDRAIFLTKLFKDADGLDRVRINRLDTSYLRNEFSKEIVDFAYVLFEKY